MTDENPRPLKPAAAFALVGGLILGLLGGGICCLFGVGLALVNVEFVPFICMLMGIAIFAWPLVILFRRRGAVEPFAAGVLIGVCLTGLTLGACGTFMLN